MGARSAYRCSTLAVLLCIAYDTSANVSPLEGGQRHLTFAAVFIITAVAGGIGALVGGARGVTKSRREVPEKLF